MTGKQAVIVFGLWVVLVLGACFIPPEPPKTHEFRLIGYCDGKLLAGMEEDDFPDGCDWIDVPVHSRHGLV